MYTYTIIEAAQQANTSAAAIKQAIRREKLAAHKILNARGVLMWVIMADDLKAWIDSPRKQGRPAKVQDE